MSIINFPILYVPDPTKGKPLFYGQIYVGEPDLDPTVEINQKQLNIVQEDGTVVPVPQPFILSAGGVPVYNGATVRLDVQGNYSLKILDKSGAQTQYYIDNVYEGEPVTVESLINDLSQAYIFNTVAEYKAFTIEFPMGKTIHLNDRNADFTVIAGTGTANTFNIIASTNVTQSISMVITDNMTLTQWGGISSEGEDLVNSANNTSALELAITTISGPFNSTGTTTSKKGTITLDGLQWTFDAVDLQERWGWRLDCGNAKIYFNGLWNIGGCAFFDLLLGYCEPVASKTLTITGVEMFASTGVGERVHNFFISFKFMAGFNRAFFTDDSWSQGIIQGGQFNNNNKCIESFGGGENVILKDWIFAGHVNQTSEIVLFNGSNAICENWQFETLPSAARNDMRCVNASGIQILNPLMNKSGGIRIEGGSGSILGGEINDSIATVVINNVSGTEWSCDNLNIGWTVNDGTGDSFTDGTGKTGVKTLVGFRSCRGNIVRRADIGVETTSSAVQEYSNTLVDSKTTNYKLTGADNVTIKGSISLDQAGQKGITVSGVNGDGNRFTNIAWGSTTNAEHRYSLSTGNGQNSIITDSGKGDPEDLGIIAGSGSIWQRVAFGVGTSLYIKSLFGTGTDNWNPIGKIERTTAQLTDVSDISNTQGKHTGREAYDTTTKRVLYANGANPADQWRDGDGNVVITPV